LAQWKGSVTWRCAMTISARGEATPRRGKGGDDVSWADASLLGQKVKKIHVVNSDVIMVKI
jgi:hypothetical protein